MSVLQEQQQALLRALWQPGQGQAVESLAGIAMRNGDRQWQRGVQAYRSNGVALAQRALAGAYPVVAQLLGEDNFNALARELWRCQPPCRGDLARWGEGLATHIESLADLREEEPYLADVARVEWLLHVAATAADGVADVPSFGLLTEQEPGNITLVLGSGAACFASGYPVVSVVNAHVANDPPLAEAGRRLRACVGETALVWREGFRPRVREATAGEEAFIRALQQKRSLADALQAAPELDFNQWLAPAVASGLLLAAAQL
jgi:hypothetical protein